MRHLPGICPALAALCTLLGTTQGRAQEPPYLEQRRADKLARPVFASGDWTTDFEQAKGRAKSEGKLVFTYFTRSYVA